MTKKYYSYYFIYY